MAYPALLQDNDSDYGSDFSPEESLIVEQLLSAPSSALLEVDNPIPTSITEHEPPSNLRIPRISASQECSPRSRPRFQAVWVADNVAEQTSGIVEGSELYPNLADRISDVPIAGEEGATEVAKGETAEGEAEQDEAADAEEGNGRKPDTRSPLERFRKKKPLSVTDLTSPAWCELQYWYALTKFGRLRRTPGMKQGSRVHKVLEDQVYETRKVTVETKEDRWGMRIWNVIIGLRTLRETGLTRELEVWGIVNGLVVNGVIDQLSYINPDPHYDEQQAQPSSPEPEAPLSNQPTLAQFFEARGGKSLKEAAKVKPVATTKSDAKVYLCDVKTRGFRSLPSNVAFRPTKVQLMLYHQLVGALASNDVDFSEIASRYRLDAEKTFSDSFLAQIMGINEENSSALSTQSSKPSSSLKTLDGLLAHNNLSLLWSLMITEYQLTFPEGVSSLGNLLKVEYRSRDEGEVMGEKIFATDEPWLTAYVKKAMEWWKGERKAEGVAIEEAYKCRSCDFAENCEWRLKKEKELRKR